MDLSSSDIFLLQKINQELQDSLLKAKCIPSSKSLLQSLEQEVRDRCSRLTDLVSQLEEHTRDLSNQLEQVSTGSTSNPVLVHLAFSTYKEHRFGGLLMKLQGISIETLALQHDTNFTFLNPCPIQEVPVSYYFMLRASFDCLLSVCLRGI